MGFIQIAMLLISAFPSALKAIKAWQDFHGAELDRERRIKLAADIKVMVQTAIDTKDTSGLETAIKNLGKPVSLAASNSQSPS